MKRGNCWAYAIPKWRKNPTETYLLVRWSKYFPFFHVMFVQSIKDLEVEEYIPLVPKKHWRDMSYKERIGAVWFEGRIRKGKGEE